MGKLSFRRTPAPTLVWAAALAAASGSFFWLGSIFFAACSSGRPGIVCDYLAATAFVIGSLLALFVPLIDLHTLRGGDDEALKAPTPPNHGTIDPVPYLDVHRGQLESVHLTSVLMFFAGAGLLVVGSFFFYPLSGQHMAQGVLIFTSGSALYAAGSLVTFCASYRYWAVAPK